ncbi:MAG: proline racemase family protein [Algicola sp.]|nr:proline racemase family protein [Algicola sp.]
MQSSLQAWFHYVKAQCCLRDHILVLNMHTGGEPANLILNCGDLPGATMREKVNQVSQSDGDYRYLHQTLMEAPVGHRDALAAVITDPIDGYGSDFGVFFIDTGGTLDMCGDNIFAASIGLTELKLTTANPVLFDTASAGGGKDGVVGLHLKMDGDDVVNTTMNNVESFVLPEHQGEVSIDCPGIGRVSCHYKIAYGGNLFAIIDADSMMVNKQKGIVVEPKNNQLFLDAGDMLRDHIRQEMGTVQIGKDSKQVDLVSFYSTKVQPNADTNIALVLKNTVVFGKQGALSLNRSP